MKNLRDLYLHKLEMAYVTETKLVNALETLMNSATNAKLREALSSHKEETLEHRSRIMGVLSNYEIDPTMDLPYMDEMMAHTEDMLGDIKDPATKDAAIIAAGQMSEHMEMALYGTLAEWADELGISEERDILEDILSEEVAADEKLSSLAEGGFFKDSINEKAADDDMDMSDVLDDDDE